MHISPTIIYYYVLLLFVVKDMCMVCSLVPTIQVLIACSVPKTRRQEGLGMRVHGLLIVHTNMCIGSPQL